MRVGIVTHGLDRPLSGTSRYTLELVRGMASLRDGPEIVLLTAGSPGPLINKGFRRVALPGCRLVPGLVTLGNFFIPLAGWRLGLDVVHDPTGVAPFAFGAGGPRTAATIYDTAPWVYPRQSTVLLRAIYRHWLPRVLPCLDTVMTVSQASKADIVHYMNIATEKVHVAYAGVSPDYRPVPNEKVAKTRARYSLPEGYILFVGSIEEQRKNLRRLLQAYALLREAGATPPLVIVGARKWKYKRIIEKVSSINPEQHVILTGYVPEPDLPALYAGASVFVFPSLYEGFGLPPLEAMACGTPVVCSNASSLPEVVGDAAMTVDPYDVEALADAIRQVLSDANLRDELRGKGLKQARRFTWERTAWQTLAVYNEALERKRSA
jgi:glycosyltransferase involved in cell wall biosynthesis